jgi:hypothetical protein
VVFGEVVGLEPGPVDVGDLDLWIGSEDREGLDQQP